MLVVNHGRCVSVSGINSSCILEDLYSHCQEQAIVMHSEGNT